MLKETIKPPFDAPQKIADVETKVLVGGLALLALVTLVVCKKNRPGKKDTKEPLVKDSFELTENGDCDDETGSDTSWVVFDRAPTGAD